MELVERCRFGAGGVKQSQEAWIIPNAIAEKEFLLVPAEVESHIGCLGSRGVFEMLGMQLCSVTQTASFLHLGVKSVPLFKAPNRHLGVKMTEFAKKRSVQAAGSLEDQST